MQHLTGVPGGSPGRRPPRPGWGRRRLHWVWASKVPRSPKTEPGPDSGPEAPVGRPCKGVISLLRAAPGGHLLAPGVGGALPDPEKSLPGPRLRQGAHRGRAAASEVPWGLRATHT